MQIDDSTAELTKMSIASELTICDSLRQKVDIAKETALEDIRNASNALMIEIDAYERECLSHWKAAKESNEHVVEDVSKRMRAFFAEKHAYMQSVHERDEELTLRLEKTNKLTQELSDRNMELKAAIFNDKLASFVAFPSIDEVTLGELAFTSIQIPFKTLDIANTDLKAIDISAGYDHVLPLEHGQHIVTFNGNEISCLDKLGRLMGSDNLEHRVERKKAAQRGPYMFVVCYDRRWPKLSVYNSSLQCLRSVDCKNFSNI